MTEQEVQEIGDKIVGVLKTIYDPEIPVDIYELGLIYDVFVNDENNAKILMTLTSPNCCKINFSMIHFRVQPNF